MTESTVLWRALWANAIFSGLSGLILIAASGPLTIYHGLPGRITAIVVGTGLLLFAAGLALNARRPQVDLAQARISLGMDLAWLVGTAIVLALPDSSFTQAGRTVLLVVDLVVGLMALLQGIGLSRAAASKEPVSAFRVERLIEAPPEQVWVALAEIGAIARWNPGVVASRTTTERSAGLGAERFCELDGGSYLQERVVAWEPQQALTMRIVDSDMPFAQADIAFELRPVAEGTQVSVAPAYRLRYGLLGHLLDRFFVRGRYRQGMVALLEGLSDEVEA